MNISDNEKTTKKKGRFIIQEVEEDYHKFPLKARHDSIDKDKKVFITIKPYDTLALDIPKYIEFIFDYHSNQWVSFDLFWTSFNKKFNADDSSFEVFKFIEQKASFENDNLSYNNNDSEQNEKSKEENFNMKEYISPIHQYKYNDDTQLMKKLKKVGFLFTPVKKRVDSLHYPSANNAKRNSFIKVNGTSNLEQCNIKVTKEINDEFIQKKSKVKLNFVNLKWEHCFQFSYVNKQIN